MKLTGYQIKNVIERLILKRDTLMQSFKPALWQFEDEDFLQSPYAIMAQFEETDYAIAAMQELQQQLNASIKVTVGSETMTMAMAVKLMGGAGRINKAWRSAVLDTGERDSYYSSRASRPTDQVRATKAITNQEALVLADKANERRSALKAAVAFGNTSAIEVTDEKLLAILKS